MADVELDVSGKMDFINKIKSKSFFERINYLSPSSHQTHEWVAQQRENVRPWTTFINTNNFKIPVSLPRLSKRIMKNIEYFQSNYLFIFLGFFVYCLLTTPLLLIALAISLAAGYKLSTRHQQTPLTLFGREVTLAEQYGIVVLLSIPLFLWAGAGAAVFWVVGASFFVITLHASFFNIEAILQSEQSVGFLEEV